LKIFKRKKQEEKTFAFHTLSGKKVIAPSPHYSCEGYKLVFELKEKHTGQDFELVVCDICGRLSLRKKKRGEG